MKGQFDRRLGCQYSSSSPPKSMMLGQHVFSHQERYPQTEPSWMHQQQNHHQQQQYPHHAAHQHAHAQAVAQHQHYNRIAGSNNTTHSNGHGISMSHENGPPTGEGSWVEENRRVLGWVAELLSGNSRETALMELSKKREQVPELAMIIWHSFGMIDIAKHSSSLANPMIKAS